MIKRVKLQTPPSPLEDVGPQAPLVGVDGKERRPSRRFLQTITLSRYLPDGEKLVNAHGVICSRYSSHCGSSALLDFVPPITHK